MDPFAAIQFQRDCGHVYDLGRRAVMEAFLQVADRIGGLPAICEVLAEYRRLSPQQLRAVGGDRFVPRPLHLVPSDDDAEVLEHEPVA
jgi:hypothetical protein